MRNSKGQFIKGSIPWSKDKKEWTKKYKNAGFQKGNQLWKLNKNVIGKVIKKCPICNKVFKSLFSKKQKYCCRKCFEKSHIKWHYYICEYCGKKFKKKGLEQRRKKRTFCCHKCFSDWAKQAYKGKIFSEKIFELCKKTGKKSGNWKGGIRKTTQGYIIIYQSKGKYAKRANLVVEKKIGRPLKSNEITHHINGIKDDDRPENLQVMDKKEHDKFHLAQYH